MRIHYRKTEQGIEIVRCYGSDGKIELPGEISGKAVTRAAAYAFSTGKSREEEDVLVYETDEAGIFRRQEQLLAGERVESVNFPDSMQMIGRYLFYGCRNLRELSFSDSLSDIGSGAFTGCRSLATLNVRLLNGRRSCVPEILGDLWQRIDVRFWEERERGYMVQTARLVFPEHYEEAVENTPARILFTQHHGSGNNYRQCFYEKEMDYRKYDSLFFTARAQEPPEVLADLVFGRLMYPAGLTGEAQEIYEAYVREHGAQTAAHLTDTGNMDALREMSRRRLWTDQSLDAAVEYAASKNPGRRGRGAERREILSFLMNEKQRFFPVRKGKYEL